MPDISATFTNKYGESRKWVILDLGRDKNAPPVIFNDYLDADQSTPALTVYSDGWHGTVQVSAFGWFTYERQRVRRKQRFDGVTGARSLRAFRHRCP